MQTAGRHACWTLGNFFVFHSHPYWLYLFEAQAPYKERSCQAIRQFINYKYHSLKQHMLSLPFTTACRVHVKACQSPPCRGEENRAHIRHLPSRRARCTLCRRVGGHCCETQGIVAHASIEADRWRTAHHSRIRPRPPGNCRAAWTRVVLRWSECTRVTTPENSHL
jgi:hypothetical protein